MAQFRRLESHRNGSTGVQITLGGSVPWNAGLIDAEEELKTIQRRKGRRCPILPRVFGHVIQLRLRATRIHVF